MASVHRLIVRRLMPPDIGKLLVSLDATDALEANLCDFLSCQLLCFDSSYF